MCDVRFIYSNFIWEYTLESCNQENCLCQKIPQKQFNSLTQKTHKLCSDITKNLNQSTNTRCSDGKEILSPILAQIIVTSDIVFTLFQKADIKNLHSVLGHII